MYQKKLKPIRAKINATRTVRAGSHSKPACSMKSRSFSIDALPTTIRATRSRPLEASGLTKTAAPDSGLLTTLPDTRSRIWSTSRRRITRYRITAVNTVAKVKQRNRITKFMLYS